MAHPLPAQFQIGPGQCYDRMAKSLVISFAKQKYLGKFGKLFVKVTQNIKTN